MRGVYVSLCVYLSERERDSKMERGGGGREESKREWERESVCVCV